MEETTREERTKSYLRHHRRRVINRKRKLITKIHGYNKGYDIYPVDGKLAKGKIHCSCPICSKKVKNSGWKHSDLKQMLRQEDVVEWNGSKLRYR